MYYVNRFYIYCYRFYIFVIIQDRKYNVINTMKSEINKKFGKRIQYLRQQRGLSQEKFAEAIDIAATSLSYIETGRGFTTLPTLQKMAVVLNVNISELFEFSTTKTSEQMYNYIVSRLQLIKKDDNKLKLIYNLLKDVF